MELNHRPDLAADEWADGIHVLLRDRSNRRAFTGLAPAASPTTTPRLRASGPSWKPSSASLKPSCGTANRTKTNGQSPKPNAGGPHNYRGAA
ncbi:MAG: hypothetical protein DCC66_07830 [Planctomycetota bacterium]|nr:MAG: hypothetical protein DCC66_07830 [Planctomycetota bacterium]